MAQAISVSIPTPEIGKPWDSGKMLDKYCSYVPAGTCPTACGLPASQVDDGKGGKIDCPATEACPVDIEEEIPVEDEPVVLAVTDKVEDKPEVKAATSQVVLAETGSTNSMFVYIVQAILTVSTILSGIFFSKKYIM